MHEVISALSHQSDKFEQGIKVVECYHTAAEGNVMGYDPGFLNRPGKRPQTAGHFYFIAALAQGLDMRD